MYRFIFAILFLTILYSKKSFSQEVIIEDSVPANQISKPDERSRAESSSKTKERDEQDTIRHHSVKRAVIQSAVIPGWGQVYNKKWWKVPIIYAGFGGLGYAIGWNAKRFRTYSDAYRIRVDGDTSTVDQFVNVYSESNLIVLKNYYKRNMNLAIIFTGVLYALNVIDAAVDAHLFEYDISDDLSLRVEPVMQFSGSASGNFTGLNMSMRF